MDVVLHSYLLLAHLHYARARIPDSENKMLFECASSMVRFTVRSSWGLEHGVR